MSEEQAKKLQMDGANARALGRTFMDNPFLKLETLPLHSGDTLEEWEVKHDAWHLGWTIEDAMRS